MTTSTAVRKRAGITVAALALLGTTFTGASSAAAGEGAQQAKETADAICASGKACLFSEKDYRGKKCQFGKTYANLAKKKGCDWTKKKNVKSGYNNKNKYSGVVMYVRTDYNDDIGCIKRVSGGNLAGTYKVKSVKWTSGKCGT